jgi:hypothetical protein
MNERLSHTVAYLMWSHSKRISPALHRILWQIGGFLREGANVIPLHPIGGSLREAQNGLISPNLYQEHAEVRFEPLKSDNPRLLRICAMPVEIFKLRLLRTDPCASNPPAKEISSLALRDS